MRPKLKELSKNAIAGVVGGLLMAILGTISSKANSTGFILGSIFFVVAFAALYMIIPD